MSNFLVVSHGVGLLRGTNEKTDEKRLKKKRVYLSRVQKRLEVIGETREGQAEAEDKSQQKRSEIQATRLRSLVWWSNVRWMFGRFKLRQFGVENADSLSHSPDALHCPCW